MDSKLTTGKSWFKAYGLPVLVIPVGGLIMIVLTILIYMGLYLLLESLLSANNPQGFSPNPLRKWSTIALVGLYLLLLRTRLPDLLKAIFLTGPLAAFIITTGHGLYSQLQPFDANGDDLFAVGRIGFTQPLDHIIHFRVCDSLVNEICSRDANRASGP